MRREDSNQTILKIGDKVTDKKSKEWKIQNIGGVTILAHPIVGDTIETIVLSKVDLTQYTKFQ